MNSTGKTTKNNPAAFQKALPLKLLTVIKKTIRRLIKGQIKASKNFLLAELLNYLSSYKRKFQFYCSRTMIFEVDKELLEAIFG